MPQCVRQGRSPLTSCRSATCGSLPLVAAVLDGETVYNGACVACHGAGIAGAPATGDANQWSTRLSKGTETLYSNAINGIGAMPAKGGQVSLSDEAVKAAVDFIIEASQ